MYSEGMEVAIYLIGSNIDIDTACHELGIDVDLFYMFGGIDTVYDTVFQCAECGFWYPFDDVLGFSDTGDNYCVQCAIEKGLTLSMM